MQLSLSKANLLCQYCANDHADWDDFGLAPLGKISFSNKNLVHMKKF